MGDETGWKSRLAPTLDDFELMARAAFDALPAAFRDLTGGVSFIVADFPDDQVIADMELDSPFDILGLFEGLGMHEIGDTPTGTMPNRISLYRRPILDYWADNDDTLGEIVTHVLIHEIGHHFGLSDDDMEALEAEAAREDG